MKESVIKFQVKNGLAKVTLNRPHVHNALNLSSTDSLLNILQTINNTQSIRVVILQASGKDFCAGADLDWMRQSETDLLPNNDSIALKLATLMNVLYHLNKPTIALVQGAVLGAGIGLVACCDIVLASPDSHFCFSEVRLGLVPAVISPYIVNVVGTRAAKRYCLTAEKISAEKAFDLGLVHEILPQQQWQSYTRKLSGYFIAAAPHALALTKRLINNVAYKQLDNTLINKTTECLTEARSSLEAKEGISAFFENRPASWINTNQEIE